MNMFGKAANRVLENYLPSSFLWTTPAWWQRLLGPVSVAAWTASLLLTSGASRIL